MKKDSILLVVVAIVVGIGGFVAGMKYQQSKTPSGIAQFGNRQPGSGTRMFNGANRNSMRPVNGEIISVDDTSITVKLQDGSSRIVLVNDKTTINKAEQASKSDLKTGEKVAAFGSDNTDGSVTAQNIQLNPILRMQNGAAGTNPGPTVQ